MLIDKMTINQNKELNSIQIKINDDVINYIVHAEEVSNKDASFYYDKIYGGDKIENCGIIKGKVTVQSL